MSLVKHAGQILTLYLLFLILSLLIPNFIPGSAGLWLLIAVAVVIGLLAWRSDRKLVVANHIETPGVASAQTRVFWGLAGIAIVLLLQLAGTWLEAVLFHLTPPSFSQAVATLRLVPAYGLVLVVIGPWLEELTFRRVLFGNLAGRLGTFGAALVAGLLFALATAPAHWLTATLVGIAYAYLYRQTGSVQTPMITHIGLLAMTLGYALWH